MFQTADKTIANIKLRVEDLKTQVKEELDKNAKLDKVRWHSDAG